jgi:type I restriction enzyme R subunit
MKTSTDSHYCVRVTANDGEIGNQYLRDFQDNERTIPTILTTSQKLSTGVDARNVRNIVLMRPINTMIEFKQIIGRGTRIYDGKDYFTIYDFVRAYLHFNDPEWDGEPLEPEPCGKCHSYPCECERAAPRPCAVCGQRPCECPEQPCEFCGEQPCVCKKKATVKLADGKERAIQHMVATAFWHPDGTPMSAQQFLEQLFGKLPEFFKDEAELRALWSAPDTRKKLLQGLSEKGFGHEQLAEMQKIINAEKSDLFDVLAYVAYALPTVTREERAARARLAINGQFSNKQQAFLEFVLGHYVGAGVDELDTEKLSPLLRLRYSDSIADAIADLGNGRKSIEFLWDFRSTCIRLNVLESVFRPCGAECDCRSQPTACAVSCTLTLLRSSLDRRSVDFSAKWRHTAAHGVSRGSRGMMPPWGGRTIPRDISRRWRFCSSRGMRGIHLGTNVSCDALPGARCIS